MELVLHRRPVGLEHELERVDRPGEAQAVHDRGPVGDRGRAPVAVARRRPVDLAHVFELVDRPEISPHVGDPLDRGVVGVLPALPPLTALPGPRCVVDDHEVGRACSPRVMTALTSLPLTSSTYVASATWPVFWASVSACSTWNDRPGFAISDANAALAACAASRIRIDRRRRRRDRRGGDDRRDEELRRGAAGDRQPERDRQGEGRAARR